MLTATTVDRARSNNNDGGAQCHGADSENGDRVDDPFEGVPVMMISDIKDAHTTFVVVQPDEDDPAWFASVAVLEESGYEIVRDLTIWMAARSISAC
ncbi:hypothetical protein [Streptomyces griseus]|uniref:hypothetical protein n=1 Tax=Streptomyces TaxID=1883 RepID=UPI001875173E